MEEQRKRGVSGECIRGQTEVMGAGQDSSQWAGREEDCGVVAVEALEEAAEGDREGLNIEPVQKKLRNINVGKHKMKCTLVTFVLQGFVMAEMLEGSSTNNRTGNYSIKYPIRPPWCSPSSSFLSDLPEACEKVGRGGWGGSRGRF